MEVEYEKIYHSLEKTHWWFVSRRDFISKIMKKYDKNIKLLEIGTSGGQLSLMLNKAHFRNVLGIDISDEAVRQCKIRNVKNVIQMNGSFLGFKENGFDLIIASDILEHIENDFAAVSEWKKVLKKDGDIIAFVPAFGFLWSNHDIVNKHYRRYSKQELFHLFERNGLKVIKISYWNFLLFFPIVVERLLKKLIKKSHGPGGELFRMNDIVNLILSKVLMVENIYCNFYKLPLGLSLFIIARKQ